MILKMNISATFVVAYIQANPLIFVIVLVHFLVLVSVLFLFSGVVFLIFVLTRRQWRCSQPQCDNLGLASVLSSHR